MVDTFVKLPDVRIKERNGFPVTAYFRNASDTAAAPTTVHYRIDDLTTRTNILDWTNVSTSTSVSITVTSAQNRIIDHTNNTETRQITVSADKGTTTETRDTAQWLIENVMGFDE